MKNISIRSYMAAIYLLLGSVLSAQDTIAVEPGLGTLEAAIAIHGGDVVYKLSAGARYGLESIVEVSDQTMGEGKGLLIVGEATEGMPPVIQIGMDGVGSAYPSLFQVFNNLTIKNVFLSAQDPSGGVGSGVIGIHNKIKLIVDNCVIDPAGIDRTFEGGESADSSIFYLTNSLIMNNGDMDGPEESGCLGSMVWDTLWVENNTFVSSGQDFVGTPTHHMPNNSFIWINHNTFLWHGLWITNSYNDQDVFFTNNLMHDISIYAQLYDWGQYYPDYNQGNQMLSLICIDTLEVDSAGTYEALPSERRFFWEYNLQYNSPQLLELPKHAVDSGYDPLYLIPMLWEDDTPIEYTGGIEVVSPADSSREHRILADDVNWPYMKYDHNWYDKDPLYNETKIYSLNDSMIRNVMGWYAYVIWREEATFTGTPSYQYEVDNWAGTNQEDYPAVWPRFDGSYTNAELLTASIEGLPLGDLNWFPEAKARWMAEKSQIEAHILALNEERYELGPGVDIQEVSTSAAFSIYPNPAGDVLHISSDRKLNMASVYDIAGKLVKERRIQGEFSSVLDLSDMNTGVYILHITTIAGESHASKILKN